MKPGAVNPHSPIGYSFDKDSGFCQVFDEHQIPEEVWEISHLVKILDLSNGKRTSLPKQLPRFSNLIAINCSQNAFTDIPKVLRDCTSLEVAIFNTCHVHTLGDDVLPPRIRAISLTNNQLSSIPSSIGQYQ